jgi:hypothetical protein
MRARNDSRVFTVVVDGEQWTEIASLENAGAEGKVFIVNHSTGTVQPPSRWVSTSAATGRSPTKNPEEPAI